MSCCSANREVLFNDSYRKVCWLPTYSESPWQYCRHCTFRQKDLLLDDVIQAIDQGRNEIMMPTRTKETISSILITLWFIHHCSEPTSQHRLYHLLRLMKKHNHISYTAYCHNPIFHPTFGKFIQSHKGHENNPASCHLICDLVSDTSPRQCFLCLYKVWKQKKSNESYNDLTSYLREYHRKPSQSSNPTEMLKEYIRYSISLEDSHHHYAFSAIYIYYSRLYTNQANQHMYDFLQYLLLEDSRTICYLVDPTTPITLLKIYSPKWFDRQEFNLQVVCQARTKWKQWIKARTNRYKEDLMIKTCHPKRLFTWILDIEELKDFDPFDLNDLVI